jgi:hypothetical protein
MKTALLFLMLCMSIFGIAQQKIHLNQNTSGSKLLSLTEESFVLKNTLSNFSLTTIQSKLGEFLQINTSNYSSDSKLGTPELPMFHQLFEIPAGATYTITISNKTSSVIDLNDYGTRKVFPHQASLSKSDDPSTVPFLYDESSYQTNSFSNIPAVSVEKLGTMRSRTIGLLKIAPFSYNPVTNQLEIITDITVSIKFANTNKSLQKKLRATYSSEIFDNNFQNVISFKAPKIEKDLIVTYPTTYVIVADPLFENALQPFVEWKTKKGFKVVEAYTNNSAVGATTNSIKSYLQNLYTNATPSSPPPSYVLFVGDIAQIPSFPGATGSHFSDLYYCEYDGNGDYFPDVYYGRFSANNLTELQPQIDKTLEYEQYLFPDDSFLNNVVLISGVDSGMAPTFGNGQINYGTSMYFNSSHGFNANVWLYPASEGNVEGDIKNSINQGCSFVNYTAHGYEQGWADPSFDLSEIATMTNDHKYPTMIGNCCQSNTFSIQTCFGEGLMRAPNKGAIGYIGGSNNTLWYEDYYWGTGFKAITANPAYESNNLGTYDCIMHEQGETLENWYVTQSQMIFSGNMAVTSSGSGSTAYYWEIYHLMGDPSLMTFLTAAEPMSVTHVTTEVVGVSHLAVHAEPHAYVAVSVNGELLAAQYTGTSSDLVLNFNAVNSIATLDVVVTKQNRKPYFGTVELIAPTNTDYIVLSAHVNDDGLENNNGLVDYGETIHLDVELKNIGDLDGNNISAVLSTMDPYVTIEDAEENWGTLLAGSSSMISASYRYRVSNTVPDQHQVHFLLTISNDEGTTWEHHLYATVNAPHIQILTLSIDDSQGNGNNRLDSGESCTLSITARNTGHADLISGLGTINCVSPEISITNATANLGTMGQNNIVTGVYSLSVSNAVGFGQTVGITNEVGDINYFDSKLFTLTIGLYDEDFETNAFGEFNWNNTSASQWITTSENPFEGNYCSKSGVISDLSTSDLTLQIDVSSQGEISFMKKVSSEVSYDFLSFYIDDVLQNEWSGELDWSPSTFSVAPGLHIFKWSYRKDETVSTGNDAAWLDNIVFPPSSSISAASLTEMNAKQMTIYPNPVHHALVVELPNQSSTWKIIIRDAQGRIVITTTCEKTKHIVLDTENFSNGFYTLEATDGVSAFTKKIIKQ